MSFFYLSLLVSISKETEYQGDNIGEKKLFISLPTQHEKTDKLDCSGVYRIKCGNCEQKYIGEAGRKIGLRIKEHGYEKIGNIGTHCTNGARNRLEIDRKVSLQRSCSARQSPLTRSRSSSSFSASVSPSSSSSVSPIANARSSCTISNRLDLATPAALSDFQAEKAKFLAWLPQQLANLAPPVSSIPLYEVFYGPISAARPDSNPSIQPDSICLPNTNPERIDLVHSTKEEKGVYEINVDEKKKADDLADQNTGSDKSASSLCHGLGRSTPGRLRLRPSKIVVKPNEKLATQASLPSSTTIPPVKAAALSTISYPPLWLRRLNPSISTSLHMALVDPGSYLNVGLLFTESCP
ncbi:unnamed protein product [Protopolystoma xenopodis]|uniref:GIY-YIG domain-containing protein n=1 Tax=Protopolystoma xenopodis TaxID=117903 RepID=A0A448XDM8_9PLAT|nr:unnamed protein product [Protopolystoma xenopodis]